jgi:hypothetical protein
MSNSKKNNRNSFSDKNRTFGSFDSLKLHPTYNPEKSVKETTAFQELTELNNEQNHVEQRIEIAKANPNNYKVFEIEDYTILIELNQNYEISLNIFRNNLELKDYHYFLNCGLPLFTSVQVASNFKVMQEFDSIDLSKIISILSADILRFLTNNTIHPYEKFRANEAYKILTHLRHSHHNELKGIFSEVVHHNSRMTLMDF